MEHNRKQKLLIIVALIVGIASLSVGFAAFSTTLNISLSASVSPSSDTFSVKFSKEQDSIVVGDVVPLVLGRGATATNGIIVNNGNPILSNLSVTYTAPGQLAKYYIYVRNDSDYVAYLNSINFVGNKTCVAESGTSDELVRMACDDISIKVTIGETEYNETEFISGHPLNKSSWEKVYIELYYDSNGTYVDGPFSITFPDVALVYSTIDDSTMKPDVVRLESGDLNTPGSIVSIGNENFYVIGQEDGNVKLLSMYNLYVGNSVNIDKDGNYVVTPLNSPTGIQDKDAVGAIADAEGNPTNFPWTGTTAFASISQKGTNYSDYNGSIVEGYVNSYASYLENLGASINEARLITEEELETLGCSVDDNTCNGAPEFVHKTSYWSGIAFDSMCVWRIRSFGILNYSDSGYDIGAGVRPVIEVPLSEF